VDWETQLQELEAVDETVYGSASVELCWRKETLAILVKLMDVVADALNKGLKILVDEEPVLYESAYSLVSMLATCTEVLGSKLVFESPEGGVYRFRMVLGSGKPAGGDEVVAIIYRESTRSWTWC